MAIITNKFLLVKNCLVPARSCMMYSFLAIRICAEGLSSLESCIMLLPIFLADFCVGSMPVKPASIIV